MLFRDLAGFEFHRLKITRNARGLQASALQLARHIDRGLMIALAARVAAFELVVGQEDHMRPPALPVGGRTARHQRNCKQSRNPTSLHGFFPFAFLYSSRIAWS